MGKGRDMDAFVALQGQGLGIGIGDFMKFIFFAKQHPQGIRLQSEPVLSRFFILLDKPAVFQRFQRTADRTFMEFHDFTDTRYTEGPLFF